MERTNVIKVIGYVKDQAQYAADVIENAKDEDVAYVVNNGMELTVDNLAKAAENRGKDTESGAGDNVTDDRGETRVVGHHKKIGLISDSLKKRLLDNGISNKELEEFMQPPKEVVAPIVAERAARRQPQRRYRKKAAPERASLRRRIMAPAGPGGPG